MVVGGGRDQERLALRTKETAGPEPLPTAASRYRYLRALARTRPSKTLLRIVVCAVWNGFSSVCSTLDSAAATTTSSP